MDEHGGRFYLAKKLEALCLIGFAVVGMLAIIGACVVAKWLWPL